MTIIERIERPTARPIVQESAAKLERRADNDEALTTADIRGAEMLVGLLIALGVIVLLGILLAAHFIARGMLQ